MVDLVDLAVPEHGAEPLQGLGCLGEEADAAHRTVQAMGDAHEDLPGLSVSCRDVSFEGFGDGLVAGLVPLDDFSGSFVEDQQMVVFL